MLRNLSHSLIVLCLLFLVSPVLADINGNITNQNNQLTRPPVVFTIEPGPGNYEPNIVFENGRPLNLREFDRILDTINPSQTIQFQLAGPETPKDEKGIQSNGVSVGKYWADVRWEYGYVPGCVHANSWHLNLQLKNTSTEREIVNIHLASWWQNGPQFGIYDSGASNFCAQSRGTFTGIRNLFTNFFQQSAGMPYWAAYAMAYTIAIICVCCLPFLIFA